MLFYRVIAQLQFVDETKGEVRTQQLQDAAGFVWRLSRQFLGTHACNFDYLFASSDKLGHGWSEVRGRMDRMSGNATAFKAIQVRKAEGRCRSSLCKPAVEMRPRRINAAEEGSG